ncbi:uncharacterized protein APUU_51326A [Aspergillus puulaauensis]|uniref:Uncharacterized protein n=1 Tax=Aspergillus puulaauensis TaxID=1220207 RepID=A0A7R7XRY2_9EURO|nr:uncharacterized protein APUU_51326A [Aspergillus puulaauensis]BCS26615.1 hypothetical protein APUU_51326A [Aspergillus puulaauensis]
MGILRSSLAHLRKNSKSCLSKGKTSANVSDSPPTNEKERAAGPNDTNSSAKDEPTEPAPSDGTNPPKRRKRDLLKKFFKGIGWAGLGLLAIPLIPLIVALVICSEALGLALTAVWSLILKPLLLLIVLPVELVRAFFC